MTADPDAVLTLGTARLISVVAEVFGVKPFEIRGQRRTLRFVKPRHVAMGMVCNDGRGLSLPQIGRWFDRDHTTVLYAERRYLGWCAELGLEAAFSDTRERAEALAIHLGVDPVPAATGPPPLPPLAIVAAAAPAASLVHPPAPETSMPRPAEPSAADAFGRIPIDPVAFAALPPAMQGEGLRLGLEYFAETHPRLGTVDRLARLARGLGLDFKTAEALADGRHPLHRLPGELAGGHADSRPGDYAFERRDGEDASGAPGGFDAFAASAIRPAPRAALVVPDAYRVYRSWCHQTHESVMPRASFGAALLVRARRTGGARQGDIITGLELVAR